MSVLAHAAHGNALGVPEWLLVALLILGTTLTWTALRTSWPTARLADAATGRPVAPPIVRQVLAVVAAAVGIAVWALTLSAGLFAADEAPENLAPFVLNLQLVGGGLLLAAVVGDWWKAANPFALLARLLPDRKGRSAPTWTAPVMFGSFLWLVACYDSGGEPRPGGIWLLLYTVATMAGGLVWGRWWVSSGEGFAVLFGSIARLAPFARDEGSGRIVLRAPLSGLGRSDLPPGAAPTLILLAGGATFGAIRRLAWWQLDVMGTRTGWDRTLVDTIGLAFVVGVAAIAWLAATRQRPSDKPLVPLALGIATAFLLTDFISRFIDVVALLSDPYGKDWNLFGTADWFPDIRWQLSTRLAWAELASLLIGAVLAVIVAHDSTLATEKGRASAERALLPQLAAGTLLATAALVILLR